MGTNHKKYLYYIWLEFDIQSKQDWTIIYIADIYILLSKLINAAKGQQLSDIMRFPPMPE